MTQSFGIVEEKLSEAEFFLGKLCSTNRFSFEAKYYFSAFVSAARSVTLALQATLSEVDGFDEWYELARAKLKTDPLAPFFVEIRNDVIHKGVNPLNQATLTHLREDLARQMHQGKDTHILVIPSPEIEAETCLADASDACRDYLASLVAVIFDCYDKFRTVVDPRWYFTQDHFMSQGKTLEDALVELGFSPNWALGALENTDTWRVLRSQQPCCQLNEIFQKYLDR